MEKHGMQYTVSMAAEIDGSKKRKTTAVVYFGGRDGGSGAKTVINGN